MLQALLPATVQIFLAQQSLFPETTNYVADILLLVFTAYLETDTATVTTHRTSADQHTTRHTPRHESEGTSPKGRVGQPIKVGPSDATSGKEWGLGVYAM